MATTTVYAATSVLDAELDNIINNTQTIAILNQYTIGVDTSTSIGQRTIASITKVASGATASQFMTSDFAKAAGTNANSRKVTFTGTGKSATAVATTTGDMVASQMAFLDASGNPLWVTTVTNQTVTASNTVNFPTVSYTANQPTAV